MPNNPIIDTISSGGVTYDVVGKKVRNTNTATGATTDVLIWHGTKKEYEDLPVKDPTTTLYNISDDTLDSLRTNCITEIPQDISLVLSNGTLTLKSGSKIYYPDGSGVFSSVTTSSDLTATRVDSQDCIVWLNYSYNPMSIQVFPVVIVYSGPTAPTGIGTFAFWYDTTENRCKVTANGGSTWATGKSFPLCLVATDGTKISAIKQVFNGVGYVGSTIFALPGVKGVIPNGRNADGTLKNTVFTLSSVKTHTQTGQQHKASIYLSGSTVFPSDYRTYDEINNVILNSSGQKEDICCVGSLTRESSSPYSITSFTTKTAFHAVDWNDAASTYATKSEVATKADVNLSNLTSVGGNIGNWSSNLTNCLVEIPQVIDLRLNNGVLTLKAGSKAYMPNGVGVFTECTNTSDLNYTPTWGAGYQCYVTGYVGSNGVLAGIGMCRSDLHFSGDTAPTATIGGTLWYDTSANKIKTYRNGNWVVDATGEPRCLFLGIVTVGTGNVITSINQVFNGFGYIGSTIFSLPNVKGLVPNGRNSNGTLKNTLFTTSSVLIYTRQSAYKNYDIILRADSLADSPVSYDEALNYNRKSDGTSISYAKVGMVSSDNSSGKISDFSAKKPFHALDFNDKNILNGWGIPDYSAGISVSNNTNYTCPKNGFIVFSGLNSLSASSTASINSSVILTYTYNSGHHNLFSDCIPVGSGDIVKINITGTNNGIVFYPAKGG